MPRQPGARNKPKILMVSLKDLNAVLKEDASVPVEVGFANFIMGLGGVAAPLEQPGEDDSAAERQKLQGAVKVTDLTKL